MHAADSGESSIPKPVELREESGERYERRRDVSMVAEAKPSVSGRPKPIVKLIVSEIDRRLTICQRRIDIGMSSSLQPVEQ